MNPEEQTAATPTPDNETATSPEELSFGWNSYAEMINGRFAMLGFLLLLLLNLFTAQDFFTWLGVR